MKYIEIINVKKSFGKTEVLKDFSLKIDEGEFVSLLGPSGCGKSTLLRCLSGLESVDDGMLVLDGENITDVPAQKRNIGMVFQQYSLFPNMTVEKNLSFPMEIQKIPKEEQKKRIDDVLEIVGLSEKKKAYPMMLSGGQQQRVALARAIVSQPKVLLLDEPLSAIDAKLRKNLQIEIRRIQKELNMTTVFVTHDQDEAMLMSDRVCLLNQGKIEQVGKPVDIYTRPKTQFAASFIGRYNVLSQNEFQQIFGKENSVEAMTAIRPETIHMSREPEKSEKSYMVQGTVTDSISVGNILHYDIDVNGVNLRVDTLFRSFALYQNGQKVWLSVEKRNCLELEE